MSKKLFRTDELKQLGFSQEREGGFTYLWLETKAGDKLTTSDLEDTGEDIPDDEYHRVYQLPYLNTQLSLEDIMKRIIKNGKHD